MNFEILYVALGAVGTLLVNLLIKNTGDRRYSKQVKLIIIESCRRMTVYLDAMINEDDFEAIRNIEARISGFKIIENLLSEMDIKLISTKDILVMFRVRELISDIIYDFEIFNKNYINIKQYNVNLETLLSEGNEENDIYKDMIKQNEKIIESEYQKLTEQIKGHIKLLITVKPNYAKLANEIYNLNKSF